MKAAIWNSSAPSARVIQIVEISGVEPEGDIFSLLETKVKPILEEEKQFNGHPFAVASICGDDQQVGDIIAK